MARHALGLTSACAWLLAAHAAAQSAPDAAPSADDLDASTAVLDASGPDSDEKQDEQPKKKRDGEPKFEITWSTLLTASGGEPETNLQLDDAGWRVEDLLRPRRNKLYPSTAVSVYGEVSATNWLLFRALFDTREIRDGATLEPPLEGLTINGNPASDELQSGSMLRELSATLGRDGLTLELGRFRADVAEGLVYEDFGAGLRARADFDQLGQAPFRVELLLTTVGQRVQDLANNQLGSLRVDWMLSPFEYVGVFVAGSKDENGEISEVVRSAYAETLIDDQQRLTSLFLQDQGSGSQGYIGMLAQLIIRDEAVLRARLVLSGGKIKLRVPLETIDTPDQILDGRDIAVDVGGIAADAELRFGLSDITDVSGFALLLSGDAPPAIDGGRYHSFIGLAPFWVWSGLFFSGGLAQGLYPNRASAAGINGRGVVGVGATLEVNADPWTGEARALLLSATVEPTGPKPPGHTPFYGAELDLRGEWRALPFLRVGTELDVFAPGRFFPSQRVAYLALGIVSLSNAQ